jgi:hypothetical protein
MKENAAIKKIELFLSKEELHFFSNNTKNFFEITNITHMTDFTIFTIVQINQTDFPNFARFLDENHLTGMLSMQ